MADDNTQGSVVDETIVDESQGEGGEDRSKNLQAEFSRKLQRQNEVIAQQDQKLNEILSQLQQATAPKAPTETTKPLKDLVYDDPDAFVKQIVAQATVTARAEAKNEIDQRVRTSSASQQAVTELQSKYPEFAQSGSPAVQRALEIANEQPPHLQGTPEGTRLAMLEAASELGLVPSSKRKSATTNSEDFSVGNSGAPARQRRQPDPSGDISKTTLEFAALLGVDTKDPKRLESLAKASKRKNFNKYE